MYVVEIIFGYIIYIISFQLLILIDFSERFTINVSMAQFVLAFYLISGLIAYSTGDYVLKLMSKLHNSFFFGSFSDNIKRNYRTMLLPFGIKIDNNFFSIDLFEKQGFVIF